MGPQGPWGPYSPYFPPGGPGALGALGPPYFSFYTAVISSPIISFYDVALFLYLRRSLHCTFRSLPLPQAALPFVLNMPSLDDRLAGGAPHSAAA